MRLREMIGGWALVAVFLCIGAPTVVMAQEAGGQHWVATWGTSQDVYRAPPQNGQNGRGLDVNGQTIRMVVRTSIGGQRARVKLSNAFGTQAVTIGAAHVAIRDAGSQIVPGSDRALSFGGKSSILMRPGMVVVSDPVDLAVPAVGDLLVSLYLPDDAGRPTSHPLGMHTTYISKPGDFTDAPRIDTLRTTQSYYWLAGVNVLAPADVLAIVGFGDSITDGARSTPNTNHNWPALLAERLAENPATAGIAVVNEGISGNQVLRDGAGVSAIARLDRDVLSQPGAKWVMLLEGINDIGSIQRGVTPTVTADQLIWAYQQIIDRVHADGMKIIGCTLTPYQGAGYYSDEGEAVREAVNAWIRAPGHFDAVVDFDAVVRDPGNPKRIRAEFDPGDHLHPNDAGYQAMADAVDLSIFAADNN